jgi:hypothetical protein
MENILEFSSVLRKKNRTNRKENKKEKKVRERIWTQHFEERRSERKVTKNLIEACLKKGRVQKVNGARHYTLQNFHVVVDRDDLTLLTAYFQKDIAP